MSAFMTFRKIEGRLEHIDVVRWQDGEIHVLGREEEIVSSDITSYMAHHIIHDASTGEVISEDSFLHRGSFPFFMCGCYMLSCEGDCPPILNHELAHGIHENQIKVKTFDDSIKKFRKANLRELWGKRDVS